MENSNKPSQKLSRILTLTGAGIVLATFVVKDVLSERLKDANDALVSARALYLSQTYNTFSQEELAYIKQEVDTVVAGLRSDYDSLKASEGVLSARAQADDDYLSVVIEYLDNLRNLLGDSPAVASLASAAGKLYENSSELSAKVKTLKEQLPGLFSAVNRDPSNKQSTADMSQWVNETTPLAGDIKSLTDQVGDLTRRILAERKSTQVKVEHQYASMRDLSYVLFFLGWVVGLLGQLWGVAPSGEG